jgi:murein L,D-transpeptidase YcbB/YkuD
MNRLLDLTFLMLALAVAAPVQAEEPAGGTKGDAPVAQGAQPDAGANASAPTSQPSAAAPASEPASQTASPAQSAAAPSGPVAEALQKKISGLPAEGSEEELKERLALAAFYSARGFEPLWVASKGLSEKASAAVLEIKNADAWGLEAKGFALAELGAPSDSAADLAPDAAADAEITLSLALLKYARFARGGRIMKPVEDLNSHLDRVPQLIEPKEVLDGAAAASDAGAYLRGLHPQQPQFELLRQKYIASRGGLAEGGKLGPMKADSKKLVANMEMWRWMWPKMGDLYVIANVPEFMLRLVKDDKVVFTEKIVAGEVGKQTSIFTRTLKHIVLRPKWRVPESIKVRELWPSMLRGGGLMKQYGLELETKDGKPLNWRTMDWTKEDIRNYEVLQAPGRKSVLGVVKFSFPSQHTIYMHDTPDRYMFAASQRTLSHGCLRLRNPVKLAELILAEDKGWSPAKIDELIKNGPLNNEIAIERKIPMHLAYFTVWVNEEGKLETYRDVYGHEKRVTQALEGKWDQIAKGADHLAPVAPDATVPARVAQTKPKQDSFFDALSSAISGGF